MKKPARVWDWIAKKYDKQAQADEDYPRAVGRFAKYLKADDTVLDYACGTGIVTYKIAADVKEVHAIDTSARMIDLAKDPTGTGTKRKTSSSTCFRARRP